ncbi:cupin domain-containing protein [Halobacillus andaensis]|uniref:cupin domain-containing protein n=1 Tax=Halobacillus andaensis TaxID=1176239 RepID=UPI003D74CAB2
MYYYPHPYYDAAAYMTRNNEQVVEALRNGIKTKVTAIDLYRRLADAAPNQADKNELLNGAENENLLLNQFTNLYMTYTGSQPEYEMKKVAFENYIDGLQKAYELAVQNYEEYRNSYLLTQHLPLSDVFLRACHNETGFAERFSSLADHGGNTEFKDFGTEPFVINIDKATKQNDTFRTALWTGEHLQVTLMSIGAGEDIGLEIHPEVDQFLRIEEGEGLVQMGDREDQLTFEEEVSDDYAIMVPAGKWHNLTNTGDGPLKLYTIYAPPEHPFGTVHKTKEETMEAED